MFHVLSTSVSAHTRLLPRLLAAFFACLGLLFSAELGAASVSPVSIHTLHSYQTDYFTGFSHQRGNNFYQARDGSLHLVAVDNYELWYFSADAAGQSWQAEHIQTGHEGDIRSAVLALDHHDAVFIAFTVNSLYHYATPTAVTYGNEFKFDLYVAQHQRGAWNIEAVADHAGNNFGAQGVALAFDGSNQAQLYANYYGWWSNGGTAWRYQRTGDGTWSAAETIAHFDDTVVDKFIYGVFRPLTDTAGNTTLIMQRHRGNGGVDDRVFYTQDMGGQWSSPVALDQSLRTYPRAQHLSVAQDGQGQQYAVYMKDASDGAPQILLSQNLAQGSVIFTLDSGAEVNALQLHSDAQGNLTLLINQDGGIARAERPLGQDWSAISPLDLSETGSWSQMVLARSDTAQGIFADLQFTALFRDANDALTLRYVRLADDNGNDTGTGETPISPTPFANIQFSPLQTNYAVGTDFSLSVIEDVSSPRMETVDVWVAVLMPDGRLLFRTPSPFEPFSPEPQAFLTAVDSSQSTHPVMAFTVPEGITGDYVFYAVLVKTGQNPLTDGLAAYASNLALKGVRLGQ